MPLARGTAGVTLTLLLRSIAFELFMKLNDLVFFEYFLIKCTIALMGKNNLNVLLKYETETNSRIISIYLNLRNYF